MRRYALQKFVESEKVDYKRILERDGLVCHICTLPVEEEDLQFDHVMPLSKGGPHTEKNIKVSHARCNQRKGARAIDAYGRLAQQIER